MTSLRAWSRPPPGDGLPLLAGALVATALSLILWAMVSGLGYVLWR